MIESQLADARDRLKAAQAELHKREGRIVALTRQVADLTGLVRQMDRNRDTLGDACRVCGERLWTGPGGARTPNHAGGCAVAAALAAKVPHA